MPVTCSKRLRTSAGINVAGRFFLTAVRIKGGEGALFPRAAGDPASVIGAAYLSYFALTASAMCFSSDGGVDELSFPCP